jgi:hypothetical protein
MQLVDASPGLDIFGRKFIGGHCESGVRAEAHEQR